MKKLLVTIALSILAAAIAPLPILALDHTGRTIQVMGAASANLDRFHEVWAVPEGREDRMDDVVFRLQIGNWSWLFDDGKEEILDLSIFPGMPPESESFNFAKTSTGVPTVDLMIAEASASGEKEPLPEASDEISEELITGNDSSEGAYQVGPEEVAVFAVHEAFHEYVQSAHGWPASDEAESRSTHLPVDPAPRLLRHRLIKTLKRAWLEPESRLVALAEARALLNRYRVEHAPEAKAIRAVDIAEGTAEYAAVAFVARTLVGWRAPQEMIRKRAFDLTGPARDESAAADSESYSIGLYAGLLLEEMGMPGWQQRSEAAPLVDVLLENVAPAADLAPASPEDRLAVTVQVDEINAQYADRAQAITRAWLAGERFIAIPADAFRNSVSMEMFASTADLPDGLEIELGFSGTAEIGSTVTIQGDALAGWLEACGNAMQVLRAADLASELIPNNGVEHKIDGGATVICIAGDDAR